MSESKRCAIIAALLVLGGCSADTAMESPPGEGVETDITGSVINLSDADDGEDASTLSPGGDATGATGTDGSGGTSGGDSSSTGGGSEDGAGRGGSGDGGGSGGGSGDGGGSGGGSGDGGGSGGPGDDAGVGPDEPEITEPGCGPGDGCFLDDCEENDDCLSGYCVDHMGDSVCTETCLSECPPGWSCKYVGTGGSDETFLCISNHTHLCRPCTDYTDCTSMTGVEDACVDYGPGGNFCGSPCQSDDDCPGGFTCAQATTAMGQSSIQCVYTDGPLCPCSEKSINLALETPCSLSNDLGTCGGMRACEPLGLGPCDANEPSEDVCNGEDDDCDGSVDESSCDDDNICTHDFCEPDAEEPCIYSPNNGVICQDDDPCTLTDFCLGGVCTGNDKFCYDNNPCTDDHCDPETGDCIFDPNETPCDDGDPCTGDDACAGGACVATPLGCQCVQDGDCALSEDGDLCNGTLRCDTSNLPYACVLDEETVILPCPDPVQTEGIHAPCLAPSCDPASGICSFVPTNGGGACDDGDACTAGESCTTGICGGGDVVVCGDESTCTTDTCDPSSGCVFTPIVAACDDGNPCTMGDACGDGICVPGQEVICDDEKPCTDDGCHPIDGCVHPPIVGECDDGDFCTTGDLCVDGECTSSGVLVCNDNNGCTDESCVPETGCVYILNTSPCDDKNACTLGDECHFGTCTGGESLNCDDGNACTQTGCDPDAPDGESACTTVYLSVACEDDNPCTSTSHCTQGVCIGTAITNCADGNPCTDDGCNEGGCFHMSNNDPCDDGTACTTGDSCVSSTCMPGTEISCGDGNPCTDDTCDAVLGCQFTPNELECDDEDACTTGDQCVGGTCATEADLDCDDGVDCTADSCDPVSGCLHQLTNSLCDDGNGCTLDLCSLEGCYNFKVANPCDDKNPCTIQDTCSVFTGLCHGYGAPANLCDDGNPCTSDMCITGQGCTHLFPEIKCNDGNDCNGQDDDWCIGGICLSVGADYTSCDDQNPCTTDSCDTVGGGDCAHEFNNAPCNDQNPCTQNDTCSGGVCGSTDFADCDDGSPCTDDTCTEIGCVHEYNTAACTDNNACTVGDSCFNGVCGSEQLTCDDDNPCTNDTCDQDTGCIFNPVSPCCGNGDIEGEENCDDGNFNDGDGCNNDCIVENCPPGTAQLNGLCWVHALNHDPVDSAHQAACASIGKNKTNTNVTMDWNEATLSQLTVAFGYSSVGDYSDSAHGMWCNHNTKQCGTHNFGGYFENYGPYPNNWWWGHGCCGNGNNNCGWWGWWGNPNYNQNCWQPDHNWLPVYTCYP